MSARPLYLAALLCVLPTCVLLPSSADAGTKGALPAPARKDLCAGVLSGMISYDHGRYHWFCSGKETAYVRKSTSFSLQCGPGKFDKRKRYGYWVSSSAVKLTRVVWDSRYAELALTFHNGSSTNHAFEYWESCLKSS